MRGSIRRILGATAGGMLAAIAMASPQVPMPVSASHDPLRDVYIDTYVTGYNTVAGQTDDTPCIGARGTNICGRDNVVACPPLLKLGTTVEISGKQYVCEDRTARKYHSRFDINCDQDKSCPYKVAGHKLVKVILR